jgi:VCBS repeat protein/Big-like domain-containing protein
MAAITNNFYDRVLEPVLAVSTKITAWMLLVILCSPAVPVHAISTPVSQTTLSVTPGNSVKAGTAVTLTATVTMTGLPVSPGLITFCNANAVPCAGPAVLGAAQLTSNGTATLKLLLGVGTYNIEAVFAGTTSAPASSSSVASLTVAGNSSYLSSTTISATGTGPYNLTATTTSFGAVAPTGPVSFIDGSDGNAAIGLANLDSATLAYSFAPSAIGSLGSGSYFTAVGDFNQDGIPDLAVVNANSNNLSVLLGNGNGTFKPQVLYAVGAAPAAVVVGDFNGDGFLDLAVVNSSPNSNNVSVLLGNGDGTFQSQVVYQVGNSPWAIAAGDFNGDGIPDLVVANSDQIGSVSVLLGNGDGTFQPQAAYPTGSFPDALVLADFNNDGILDIATADSGDNDISILLGNGDGTFAAPAVYAVGVSPYAIAAGDFNGDGYPDLITANYSSNTVSVLLGNGDGTFQAQVPYSTGSHPAQVTTGNFNNDDILDVAVANSGDNTVSLLLGKGDGTFKPQTSYPVGHTPSAIVAVDLNGDGLVDLAVTNFADNTVSILLGQQSETATAGNVNLPDFGTQNVLASYSGDASRAASKSSTISLIGPSYTISASPASLSVASGGTLKVNITATPLNGSFSEAVTMSASGLPSGASASFSPATLTPGKSGAQTTLTVQFPTSSSQKRERVSSLMALGLLLGFAFIGTRRKDFRNALSMILVLALLIAPTIMLSGCSGFSSASSSPKPQPPAPTNYVITVVGTCGSLTASTTVTVTVE